MTICAIFFEGSSWCLHPGDEGIPQHASLEVEVDGKKEEGGLDKPSTFRFVRRLAVFMRLTNGEEGRAIFSSCELKYEDSKTANNELLRSIRTPEGKVLALIHARGTYIDCMEVKGALASPFQPLLSRFPACLGHRGLGGDSYGVRVRENTLLSFEKARAEGAEGIEFDVFLTSDGKIMIFHDLMITTKSGAHLPVTAMRGDDVKGLDSKSLKNRSPALKTRDDSGVCYFSSKLEDRPAQIYDEWPTLKDVLKHTPSSQCLLIELKYPSGYAISEFPSRLCHSRNHMASRVLREVDEHSQGERRHAFSSFDGDLCICLKSKQSSSPVFFNVCFGYEHEGNLGIDYRDSRNLVPEVALKFCTQFGLGLVGEALWFLENPGFVGRCREEGVSVMSYGAGNRELGNWKEQREAGLEVVISDNLGRLKKEDGSVCPLSQVREDFWH